MPAPEAERPLTGALMATVETVSFEPGLYAVTIVAVRTPAADLGLTLPCIRIETLPPTAARPGRATVVDARDTGWLCQSEEPAYILVIGGSASTILTIYRARDGGPAPEIHITHIPTVAGKPAVAAAFGDSAVPPIEGGEVALGVFAHISDAGDVTEPVEGWIGRVGSGLPLEGFTLTPAAPLRPEDIEYQAILGASWCTPWFRGGKYCGSRGMELPLLGFRVRLSNPDSAYECVYAGRFIGGAASGPHRNGEACQAGEAPLEAIQIRIRRRQATPPTQTAPPNTQPKPAAPPRKRGKANPK
jgi:hypothetical protein